VGETSRSLVKQYFVESRAGQNARCGLQILTRKRLGRALALARSGPRIQPTMTVAAFQPLAEQERSELFAAVDEARVVNAWAAPI
jgi:hypothetical protein